LNKKTTAMAMLLILITALPTSAVFASVNTQQYGITYEVFAYGPDRFVGGTVILEVDGQNTQSGPYTETISSVSVQTPWGVYYATDTPFQVPQGYAWYEDFNISIVNWNGIVNDTSGMERGYFTATVNIEWAVGNQAGETIVNPITIAIYDSPTYVNQLLATNANLSGQLSSARQQIANLQGNLTSVQGQLQNTKSQLQSTQAQLENTTRYLVNTTHTLQATQTELASTQASLKSTQTTLYIVTVIAIVIAVAFIAFYVRARKK